jgi:hypothetical protein
MAKKDRNTLKKYFEAGRLPSSEQFADLIDSMLNVIEEGFDKTAEEGFKVSQIDNTGKLISFYENIEVKKSVWSLRLDMASGKLIFDNQANPNVLTLDTKACESLGATDVEDKVRIGINKQEAEYELDVEGTVASRGRIGGQGEDVPADGKWHDITKALDGCQAFEIMAGVGKKGAGKYALVHAMALNTFNSKGKITYNQAHYGSRCNRIKLRWKKKSRRYALQLKTRCCYGEGIFVRYYLTRLWFDPFMQACQKNR